MSALDHLVRRHVTPPMAQAGFTVVGRTFRAIGPSGDHAFVWYQERRSHRPGAVTFHVTASLITTTWWDFLTRDDPTPGLPRPDSMLNTLIVDVPAPVHEASRPNANAVAGFWSYDAESRAACGARLADTVATDIAPWLLARLDRNALLAEIEHPTRRWRGAPHGKTTQAVLALLDSGSITEIERRLPAVDDLTPDGALTAWIRARLAGRSNEGLVS